MVQKKCGRCGSTYSATADSSDYCEECKNTEQPPANNPKFTVEDIAGESKYASTQCRICGKTPGWFYRSSSIAFRSYRMCEACFSRYVNYLKSPNVKSCNKCGYFEDIQEDEENPYSLISYFTSHNVTFKCKKFGFEILPKQILLAQKCAGFITKQKYAEKCLNGQINPIAQNLVICQYCKYPYDLFESTKCPHCGGSTKIPTA